MNTLEPSVLFEDNHLLIVSKPAGLLVQPDPSGDPALEQWAERYIAVKEGKAGKAFVGVPHRLDRPTSGIVILAKTSKALVRLNQLFKDHTLQKTYWAIVEGHLEKPTARLEHLLARDSQKNKSYVTKSSSGQRAVLTYETLAKGTHYTLLSIDLETGRHHQIRAQFSAIGHPVKGDVKYGARRGNLGGFLHLHAKKVAFAHPVGGAFLVVEAPLPEESVWKTLESSMERK